MLFANIPLDDVPIAAVINAERGHGMDVVAPWLVVQAKHNVTLNSSYNVNVMEELGKAGLFAGSPLTPLTKALMVAWKNVPISTPPAVLTPLSDLLEHVPKNRWDKSIGVAKNALKERNLGSSSNTSTSKNTPVVTHETVDSVPKGSVRVVLLLVMNPGYTLDEALIQRLRQRIRDNASPRHVPARILAVQQIPYTRSGKKVELAVAKLLRHEPVSNREALANPEALDEIAGLQALWN